MSNPSPLKGVVVTHDGIGQALVVAVERISGIGGVLTAVTNEGCDRTKLSQLVVAAVAGGPTVVFVDLFGGSCFHAALQIESEGAEVAVVAGANLAMLLHFVHHLDETPDEAADAAVEIGRRAIKTVRR